MSKLDDAWIEEQIAKLRASVEGNVCCVCGGTITKKVQVHRCVYAEPCGHRLYQGTIVNNNQQREVEL